MNELIKLVYFVEIVLRFIFLAFVRIVAESLRICSVHMYFWTHTCWGYHHRWVCVCVCVCVKPCIISYIQTRYTSANQQAIEVNGHHDFAANRHVVGYRFRWGWGTSMPSKNARKWVWKGFNFKCDYRHHIVITNDSDFSWPHLQMCGVFVFGKSWPKRSLT